MTDRKRRLLLVEDDAGIGQMLDRGLTGAGYAVDWVRDLASAVEKARSLEHGVVVLDRMLPDGDGADLCAALRRFGHPAPVCMLTARDSLDDKLHGFSSGADDYLTKPFEFDELLARLEVLARRGTSRKPALLLDAETRQLVMGPRRVKLTRRECGLMEHFLRTAGQLVPRAELKLAGWPPDGDVSDNAVDVYVGYLRRKLAQIEDAPRIETVRGEGFRLLD